VVIVFSLGHRIFTIGRASQNYDMMGRASSPNLDHGRMMKAIESLSAEEERAAAVFRALGNPARLGIVTELARRNACFTGDLVDVLPLAQSTVSQHLKVLKDAGIIRGTIEGDPCYCLDPDAIQWLVQFCTSVCCGPEGCGEGGAEAP
jgi:ArsR family transcriptional regulator